MGKQYVTAIWEKVRKGIFLLGVSLMIIGYIGWKSLGNSADFDPFRILSGIFGESHILGTFLTTGGNAGKVIFPKQIDNDGDSEMGVFLDASTLPDVKLTGNFFSETVGWIRLEDPTYMIPPALGDNLIEPWEVSGYAWSDAIGYIKLDSANPSEYSGAHFLPKTQSFSGFAWSDNIGYIPFSDASGIDVAFVGRVRVLGNIGGNKSFDIQNYLLGSKINPMNATDAFNLIHKNVSILTRNILPDQKNTIVPSPFRESTVNSLGDFYYFSLNGEFVSIKEDTGAGRSILQSGKKRSLIIEGGDLFINTDILPHNTVKMPLSIIVLKKGNLGGNIYIDKSVKNIYATVVAEGSIFSGERQGGTWIKYNDSKEKITNLPINQLYIKGSIISNNTIGGAVTEEVSDGACPYTEDTCTRDQAIQYDMNYWRLYDKSDAHRSDKSGYDGYSVIIEHDPRILREAPPGLETR